MPKFPLFKTRADQPVICTACGVSFHRPAESQIEICSEACRKARRRAHAAASRKRGLEMRADMLERFGGKWPSPDDLVELIKARKGRPN